MHMKPKFVAYGAVIAALFLALCYLQNAFVPSSVSSPIQIRAAEALCELASFTPAAVPGLTIGCLLFNISFAGAFPLDPVVGTLGSFLAAEGMYLTRRLTVKGLPLLGLFMPAVTNAFLVGWELDLYIGGGFWLNALYVAIGEAAVLLTLGVALYYALKPHKARLFKS